MKQNKEEHILIILFGLPGTGKNVAGEFLRDTYGFFFCDGDAYLTDVQKENHRKGIPTTIEQRDIQFKMIIKTIRQLQTQHLRLVVTSWLPERYQRDFQKAFPNAFFILITTPTDQINQRLSQRKSHYINKDYALYISKQWGEPVVANVTIKNDSDLVNFRKQIELLLKKMSIDISELVGPMQTPTPPGAEPLH